MCIVEADGVISLVNGKMAKLCGYPKEKIEGKMKWTAFVAKKYLPIMKKRHEVRCKKGGKAVKEYEFDFVRKNGEIRRIFLRVDIIPGTKKSVCALMDITERVESEEALEKALEELNKVVKAAPFGIYIVNQKGGIDYVNPAMLKISGDIERQFKNLNVFKLTTYKKLGLSEKNQNVFKGKTFEMKGIEYVSCHGKKKTVRNIIGLPFDVKGERKAMIFVDDISERKKAEAELRERLRELNYFFTLSKLIEKRKITTEEILQGAVDNLPAAFQLSEFTSAKLILDDKEYETKNYKETKWRIEAGIKIFGKEAGALIISLTDNKPFKDRKLFLKEEKELVKTISEYLEQIIERRRSEQVVRRTQDELQSIFDNVNDGIAVVSMEGRILKVNRRTLAIAGVQSKDLLGKKFSELPFFTSESIRRISHLYNKIIKGVVIPPFEIELVPQAGEEKGKVVEFQSALMIREGQPTGIVVVIRDISERKRAEEEARELDILKSRFITALTHVTRTPLNEVRWNLESLLSGEFDHLRKEQRVFVRRALQSQGEVLRLIRNMNTTLDIERGTLILEKAPTALSSLVKSIIGNFKTFAELKGVELKYVSPRFALPPILIDAEKIRRVLEIFIINAIRYTREGGLVTVALNKKKNVVIVKITDTGIGIPAAEQGNIFARFFRASNAQIEYPDGVGLGLYIAKSIVEKHDGQVGFESKENHGSTFWFSLQIK